MPEKEWTGQLSLVVGLLGSLLIWALMGGPALCWGPLGQSCPSRELAFDGGNLIVPRPLLCLSFG